MKTLTCLLKDIAVYYIIPHLHYQDVARLLMVSKEVKQIFHSEEYWKQMFLREKGSQYYDVLLKRLSLSNRRRNPTMYWAWTNEMMVANRCRLIIKNESTIPCHVYWNNEHGKYKKMTKRPILPGENYHTYSYPNHKWICIPIKKWFEENNYSNVGFSFLVNILEQQTEPTSNKLAFVKSIWDPDYSILQPIKGTRKKYSNYKEQFVRVKFDKGKNQKKIEKNEEFIADTKRNIRDLQVKLNILQKNLVGAKEKAICLNSIENAF